MDGYLAKYQNPKQADAMTKIQSELDETKIILVSINNRNTIRTR
jgi:synaptobrevin family protein YKT6